MIRNFPYFVRIHPSFNISGILIEIILDLILIFLVLLAVTGAPLFFKWLKFHILKDDTFPFSIIDVSNSSKLSTAKKLKLIETVYSKEILDAEIERVIDSENNLNKQESISETIQENIHMLYDRRECLNYSINFNRDLVQVFLSSGLGGVVGTILTNLLDPIENFDPLFGAFIIIVTIILYIITYRACQDKGNTMYESLLIYEKTLLDKKICTYEKKIEEMSETTEAYESILSVAEEVQKQNGEKDKEKFNTLKLTIEELKKNNNGQEKSNNDSNQNNANGFESIEKKCDEIIAILKNVTR